MKSTTELTTTPEDVRSLLNEATAAFTKRNEAFDRIEANRGITEDERARRLLAAQSEYEGALARADAAVRGAKDERQALTDDLLAGDPLDRLSDAEMVEFEVRRSLAKEDAELLEPAEYFDRCRRALFGDDRLEQLRRLRYLPLARRRSDDSIVLTRLDEAERDLRRALLPADLVRESNELEELAREVLTVCGRASETHFIRSRGLLAGVKMTRDMLPRQK